MEFKRKIYKRGSSFETTIPMPLLFALDMDKKHNVVFKYDSKKEKWYLEFDKVKISTQQTNKLKRGSKK